MKPQECCVLIPSLDPDQKLPDYVRDLHAAGFGLILVVDDGSKAENQHYFDAIEDMDGCHVLHHEVNRGKGAALKTGFKYLEEHTALLGVITADSDGQHTVPDTLKLAGELSEKEELLLGSRDFSKNNPNVPPKSRFGNRMTSGVFKLLYGQWLPDTQTGLRAFPRSLLGFMGEVGGDRFEYEMTMLIQCSNKKIPMRDLTIETIYHEENKGTHFHPIRDSWRIYKVILSNVSRYTLVSILSFLIDYAVLTFLMFCVFRDGQYAQTRILGLTFSFRALVATPIARLFSAPVNFLLNRNYVFQGGRDRGAVKRYIVLAVCGLIITTLVFAFLDQFVTAPALHILLKIVIDVFVYLVNYRIQKAWVFPEGKE